MTDREIDLATDRRLEGWSAWLKSEHATPMFIVGLRLRDDTLVVAACEDIPDKALELVLRDALAAIEAGRIDHR